MFLYGSMLIPGPSIPAGWLWLWYVNPLHYAAEAVWVQQFYCSPADDNAGLCPTFAIGPGVPLSGIVKWDFVYRRWGLKEGAQLTNLAVVVGFWLAYLLCAAVTRRYLTLVRR